MVQAHDDQNAKIVSFTIDSMCGCVCVCILLCCSVRIVSLLFVRGESRAIQIYILDV